MLTISRQLRSKRSALRIWEKKEEDLLKNFKEGRKRKRLADKIWLHR